MRVFQFVVLLVVVVLVLVLVLRPRRVPGRRPPALHDELVKDPVCGTYVVRSRAVRGAGPDLHFCSPECARRYAAETRG